MINYKNVIESFEIKSNSKDGTEKQKMKDTETQKTKAQKDKKLSFTKELVENTEFYKFILNKIMTTLK